MLYSEATYHLLWKFTAWTIKMIKTNECHERPSSTTTGMMVINVAVIMTFRNNINNSTLIDMNLRSQYNLVILLDDIINNNILLICININYN